MAAVVLSVLEVDLLSFAYLAGMELVRGEELVAGYSSEVMWSIDRLFVWSESGSKVSRG